jgi:hypothetical protein
MGRTRGPSSLQPNGNVGYPGSSASTAFSRDRLTAAVDSNHPAPVKHLHLKTKYPSGSKSGGVLLNYTHSVKPDIRALERVVHAKPVIGLLGGAGAGPPGSGLAVDIVFEVLDPET